MGQFLKDPLRGPICCGDRGQSQALIYFRPEGIIKARNYAWHMEDVTSDTRCDNIGIVGRTGCNKRFGLLDAGLNQNFPVESNTFNNPSFKAGSMFKPALDS